jgi:hypothetical protein
LCREQIAGGGGALNLGIVFTESGAGANVLETIWERGQRFYIEQAGQMPGGKKYDSLCAGCDEYYTYNF